MHRGDLVPVAIQGDFGKPRPALIVQSDLFNAHESVTVLPVTSSTVDAPLLRVTVTPSPQNGLRQASQIMVDKAVTVRRDKLGRVFGHIEADTLLEVESCMAVFLGIAK
ncbi:growth inhibitor PemK [Achromobacter sp. HZ01]|uniref:type II toxin-antitoxin system PemK/MazF family toxin n=1 Tax=Achromobacter sp. HZ01 TaxID=1416886 RepID=UPI000DC28570|nr:type II toxin-antitoxin system PemK/MazF family toxin [Achromobacter sp. HZ01]RAP65591.1 growth inhibitor PemK [Achromobacter sp. HZ01]